MERGRGLKGKEEGQRGKGEKGRRERRERGSVEGDGMEATDCVRQRNPG